MRQFDTVAFFNEKRAFGFISPWGRWPGHFCRERSKP